MIATIELGNFKGKITPIKFNKTIYWITTPHGIFIEKGKEYLVTYQNKDINVKLYKQSYRFDLAIFKSKTEIKLAETKILKSNKIIFNSKIYNNDIEGIIETIDFIPHLNITNYNRNMFYGFKLLKGNLVPGDSGMGFFSDKNQLIGIFAQSSNTSEKYYLVPALFIQKLLVDKHPDFIPYLPIKVTLDKDNAIIKENFSDIKRGFKIKKFGGKPMVNKYMVYYKEINDNIPFDVYFMIIAEKEKYISISNNISQKKIRIQNLNDYLQAPFVSGITKKEFDSITTETYQSLSLKKFTESDPLYYQDILKNNIIIK